MRPLLQSAAAALLLAPLGASAAPPLVATDIAPVHSLAAMAMEGLGEPALILPPGASPHDFSLRPSQAQALAQAELVFWIGPALAPWLGETIEALTSGRSAPLAEAEGVEEIPLRESPLFEPAEDHGAEDHDHEAHAHDHGAEAYDPHVWLNPANGAAMLSAIAEALAAADPENAARYRANAEAGAARIAQAAETARSRLAPLRGRPFMAAHDSLGHFEAAFGLQAMGAVADAEDRDPGPRRVSRVREALSAADRPCLFAEPGGRAHLEKLAQGTGARIAVIDPLGADLTPGPGLYPALIEGLAETMADCLGG